MRAQSLVVHDLAGGTPLLIKEICYLMKKNGFVAVQPLSESAAARELLLLRPPSDLAPLLTSGSGGNTKSTVSLSIMASLRGGEVALGTHEGPLAPFRGGGHTGRHHEGRLLCGRARRASRPPWLAAACVM